jgi:PAS domain S-box-containing protein
MGRAYLLSPYPTPLYDEKGALAGAVNMLVDISSRKRAELELMRLNEQLENRVAERTREVEATLGKLRASERQFRLLVEGVEDYAIFMLRPDGTIASWNVGAERIKGYRAAEIIGQHFSRFYTDEERSKGTPEKALRTARRAGKYEAEGWRVRKDGSHFWASVLMDAIHDDTGELVGFAKITRDLTDKRQVEEQLRQAQKMEAIGQLTGGVAHDFNNLLTAIIGNLDFLATILRDEERPRRHAEAALRAAWRGARLTEDLLAFARRGKAPAEIIDVNRQLNEISSLCQRTVGDAVAIVMDLAKDLWTCRVNAAQFEAAVLNLAANSRDAMQGAGSLTISTANARLEPKDTVELEAGDYVVVTVRDTGCGMSEEVLKRALEPFYTTKDVGKGTGLGLSQVYGFAKQYGGGLRIDSAVGRGTIVRIYLPRVDGIAAEEKLTEELPGKAKSTATILVVEDDADVRELVVGIVSELGYRTRAAGDGPEALAILRDEGPIDLMFTDHVMPSGMTGAELGRTARQLRPGMKVLLSSGHPGDEVTSQALRADFPFIAKPFGPGTLAQKIKEVLAANY